MSKPNTIKILKYGALSYSIIFTIWGEHGHETTTTCLTINANNPNPGMIVISEAYVHIDKWYLACESDFCDFVSCLLQNICQLAENDPGPDTK